MDKYVESWDQRKNVGNENDGMYETGYDAERENIQVCCYLTKSCAGMYIITQSVQCVY